jgi:hypothetical protein
MAIAGRGDAPTRSRIDLRYKEWASGLMLNIQSISSPYRCQRQSTSSRQRFPLISTAGRRSEWRNQLARDRPSALDAPSWSWHCAPDHRAGPTVSAIFAPRQPSGFGSPTVLSRAVWCSVLAFSLAPIRMTIIESQIRWPELAEIGLVRWVSCASSRATDRSGRTPKKGARNLTKSPVASRTPLRRNKSTASRKYRSLIADKSRIT